MRGIELDAFFRHHQMALEVQGAQHRLHRYRDIKKLEDIVGRDLKKESYVSLTGFFFLKQGMTRIQKSLFPRRYIILKSVLVENALILIN
jgi:hypothetical protein